MNVNMWNHPATQANLEVLKKRGVRIVEPGEGYLACGMTGPGRLAENDLIVAAVLETLGISQELAGETVLITAGPTREKIDPVRYLTNRSSGRMGYALAEAALRRGARVLLVSGPVAIDPPAGAELTRVETAEQMRDAVLQQKLARVVVLDLSEVESIDAGGLTVLVDLHRWTENNRSHLKLVNPRPFVHQMLTRTHLSCVFDISSFNEALSVLGCERGHAKEREQPVAVAAF